MKKTLLKILTATAPLLTNAAASPNPLPQNPLPNGPRSIVSFMNILGNWFFSILIVLAVIYILMAAFEYLTASGNSEKISKAHKMIIYAGIALAVGFLAKGIVIVVAQIVGVNEPNLNIQ